MPDIPKFLVDGVNAMDTETRKQFIKDTLSNTPPSKVQLQLREFGLTISDVRRWLRQTYPGGVLRDAQR